MRIDLLNGFANPPRRVDRAECPQRGISGDWVLRAACAQNKLAGPRLAQAQVAVNLSPTQLRQQDFAHKVQNVLAETGLEPKYLEFELSPWPEIPDLELAVRIMSELRQIGVQLAVHGFGTGYASLRYLRRFPLDQGKIHRFFVEGLPEENGAGIVRATIGIAQSLGLGVVAVGVEKEEQLTFLRAQNCDQMQGFLFSRPLPPQELAELLRGGGDLPGQGSA